MTRKMAQCLNIVLSVAIVVLIAIIIVLTCFVSSYTVLGNSMENTLQDKEKIWIQKVAYDINIEDIVVFKLPEEEPYVKRVIAMGGDSIRYDIQQGAWFRNGVKLEEDYIAPLPYRQDYCDMQQDIQQILTSKAGLVVPNNELFVLGDNRNVSKDSHVFGTIKKEWLIGKKII